MTQLLKNESSLKSSVSIFLSQYELLALPESLGADHFSMSSSRIIEVEVPLIIEKSVHASILAGGAPQLEQKRRKLKQPWWESDVLC